eukprot:1093795-Rhodomonas_salina.1
MVADCSAPRLHRLVRHRSKQSSGSILRRILGDQILCQADRNTLEWEHPRSCKVEVRDETSMGSTFSSSKEKGSFCDPSKGARLPKGDAFSLSIMYMQSVRCRITLDLHHNARECAPGSSPVSHVTMSCPEPQERASGTKVQKRADDVFKFSRELVPSYCNSDLGRDSYLGFVQT